MACSSPSHLSKARWLACIASKASQAAAMATESAMAPFDIPAFTPRSKWNDAYFSRVAAMSAIQTISRSFIVSTRASSVRRV